MPLKAFTPQKAAHLRTGVRESQLTGSHATCAADMLSISDSRPICVWLLAVTGLFTGW
jgi:hypothetical protein